MKLSGDWTQKLWKPGYATQPLRININPNIVVFFTQERVPYLWPKDKLYIKNVNSKDDPQRFLRDQWAIVYLHHPNSEIIVQVLNFLPKILPKAPIEVILEHAALLTHTNHRIREEAGKTIGKYEDVVAKLSKYTTSSSCFVLKSEATVKFALPVLDALIAIGNQEANKTLRTILSVHLTNRKAQPISSLKKSLDHLKNLSAIAHTSSFDIMGTLRLFNSTVFGYGWIDGGIRERDLGWKEESIFLKLLAADPAIIKEEFSRLVSLLRRLDRNPHLDHVKIERNPIAQLFDRHDPIEFLPLIKDYIEVLEGLVGYIEKHKYAILNGLKDSLRYAESGYDYKFVKDSESQIKNLSSFERAIKKLKSWLDYWKTPHCKVCEAPLAPNFRFCKQCGTRVLPSLNNSS